MGRPAKTQEERIAIAAKAVATRRANAAKKKAIREEAKLRVLALKDEIAELEAKRARLSELGAIDARSAELTGSVLLREEEIVDRAHPWHGETGVYFLISDGRVVYVGQSTNVYARVHHHSGVKKFDSYAYVRCAPEIMDKLESLYIHYLRPPLNGRAYDGEAMCAPIPLQRLLNG